MFWQKNTVYIVNTIFSMSSTASVCLITSYRGGRGLQWRNSKAHYIGEDAKRQKWLTEVPENSLPKRIFSIRLDIIFQANVHTVKEWSDLFQASEAGEWLLQNNSSTASPCYPHMKRSWYPYLSRLTKEESAHCSGRSANRQQLWPSTKRGAHKLLIR